MNKLLILIFLLFICKISFATDYFVSTIGSDSNDCLSIGLACATLNYVCDNKVVAGDRIFVSGDGDENTVDYNGISSCAVDGTASAHIVIDAYDHNDKPTFSWKDPYTGGWTNVGTNLWRTTNTIDASNADVYAIYLLNTTNGNVTIMNKEFSTGAVDAQNDFFAYKGSTFPDKLLIYSTTDPNTFTEEFRFVASQTGLSNIPISIDGEYYDVSNLKTAYSWVGFQVSSGSSHQVLTDIESFYNPNRGFSINTSVSSPISDIKLIRCIAHHGQPSWNGYSLAPDQHGFKLASSSNTITGNDVLFKDCQSYSNYYHGVQISEAFQGVEIDGGIFHDNNLASHSDGANIRVGTQEKAIGFKVHNVESYNSTIGINLFSNINDVNVYNNYIHDINRVSGSGGYGINVNTFSFLDSCPDNNCYVFNNVIHDASHAGILMNGSPGWTISNNTIDVSGFWGVYFLTNTRYTDYGVSKNNIIIGGSTTTLEKSSAGITFTSDYNSFYSSGSTPFDYGGTTYNFSDYQTASGQNSNSLFGDISSEFTDYALNNYSIKSNSTIKDLGANTGFNYDYRMLSRPQGSGYSIGAYEEGNASSIRGVQINGISL